MKQLVRNYALSTSAKTITLSDFATISIERILLVTDVTTSATLYQFNATTGASVTGNVLTLPSLPSGTANTDKLQIFYDVTTGDPVYDAASPLSSGAATVSAQSAGNTSLASIDTKTPALAGGKVPVDGSGVTQPVSASALPLPSGAATSAAQGTGNTSLASIDTKTPALTAGNRVPVDGSGVTQPVSASSLPLPTGAAQDGADVTAAVMPSGGSGIRGWLSGIYTKLAGTLSVSGSVSVSNPTTNYALEAGGNLASASAALTATNGLATRGSFVEIVGTPGTAVNSIVIPSTDVSSFKWASVHLLGTFSATLMWQGSNDNSNWSGINLFPVNGSAGSGATSYNFTNAIFHGPVAYRYFRVIVSAYTSGSPTCTVELYTQPSGLPTMGVSASQFGSWTVTSTMANTSSSTGSLTTVAATTTNNTTLLANNANRKGMMVYNESTAVMYLSFAATCSPSTYSVQVPPNSLFEMPTPPVYTQVITCVWASATGNARVTELT